MGKREESAEEILEKCKENGFYGEVTVKFKNGCVVHIIKAESIKVD